MEEKQNIKAENFRRLAEARTEKVMSMIDLIGNLSNKSFYEYSDKQVEEIFNSIQECLNENIDKFKDKKKKNKRRFKL